MIWSLGPYITRNEHDGADKQSKFEHTPGQTDLKSDLKCELITALATALPTMLFDNIL
jgi:hypothetical protein